MDTSATKSPGARYPLSHTLGPQLLHVPGSPPSHISLDLHHHTFLDFTPHVPLDLTHADNVFLRSTVFDSDED